MKTRLHTLTVFIHEPVPAEGESGFSEIEVKNMLKMSMFRPGTGTIWNSIEAERVLGTGVTYQGAEIFDSPDRVV